MCVCACVCVLVLVYACVCSSVQMILKGLQSFQTATIVLAKVVPSDARNSNNFSSINKSILNLKVVVVKKLLIFK